MRREPGQDFNLPELDQLLARLGQWRTRLPGWWMIFLVIFALWLGSGIYIVNPDQIGVVQRFGAYRYTTNPGPHWRLPWPIEQVTKPRVTKVERLEIGFRTYAGGAPGQYRSEPAEALMLTGDENIVKLEFIVQYRIKDPMDYLFRVRDQVATIKQAAEAAMREVIGKRKIDEALTEGKAEIRSSSRTCIRPTRSSRPSATWPAPRRTRAG
ncbi:MAG: protease modulator HflK [Proteobacteria bacterium]|nr:protease modulator HflK [Pseudomonadota bacterium]